jgi:hypothetical protein
MRGEGRKEGDMAGRGEEGGREARERRGCAGRAAKAAVVLVLLAAVGATAAYVYYRARGEDPFEKFATGFDRLADSLGDRKAAGKVREIGELIEERGPEVETYSDDIQKKLLELKEVGGEAGGKAYRAAKEWVDEYFAGREDEEPEEETEQAKE